MISKNTKIYIAGHRGMVESAVWRIIESKGYSNTIGKSGYGAYVQKIISD